jgi:hypothetical protein
MVAVGRFAYGSDALMSREIIIYDVTTAKVSHVDVEQSCPSILVRTARSFFETKEHASSSTMPQCKFENSGRTGTRL